MMNFISNHKIMAGIVILLLIAAAWYGFTQTSGPAPILTTTSATSDTNPADQDLVTTLLTLQAVSLNGTIFTDPGFLALQDFTTQIVSEPVGRPDPFAPLSASIIRSATSTGTSNPNLFAPAKH
jgi:hypothetical protein